MEKQPNSRMCFAWGIENPVDIDEAPSASSSSSIQTATTSASHTSILDPNTRAVPAKCTVV
jgi:hypothetical protein